MSDDAAEHNETAPQADTAASDAPAETLSRKDRNAARRAEFEAMKAAKSAEKAAAKEAQAAERAAAKETKEELIAQAKAAKEAAKAAKKESKSASKSAEKPPKEPKAKKEKKEKPAKPEKDPYRPRFATAPTKVRAFTVIASVFALVHLAGALLLLAETTSSPVLGVVPEDVSSLAYVGAVIAFAVTVLWTVSAVLLCAGRVLGKHLGVAAFVLGLPLTVVVAPMLFSSDVRDWAL